MASGAASTTNCHVCGSDEIDYDPARGDAACVNCGAVVQQSLIVNDVAFQEDARGRSNLVGQHVRADGQGNFSILPGHSRQATENTMSNARFRMLSLASQLRLSSRYSDQALRLFRLAVEQNFHKGRRVTSLCCACLYTVCRLERTPHMLIDFADVSQTNLYALGNIYLKLVRLLSIQLPVIDPSLYMHRFAAKLEYGDKTNDVAMTALRITARMQRDWMTHGRRPAGLCGAALLTASIMHSFYRSQAEVARVVRIGNVVLRNRLRELDQTTTASLTAEQIDAGGGDDGKWTSLREETLGGEACDPPAFARLQLKKARTQQAQSTEDAATLSNGTEQEKAHNSSTGNNAELPDTADNESSGARVDMEASNRQIAETTGKTSQNASSERKKKQAETEFAKQAVENEQVDEMMEKALASDEMRALDEESQIDLTLTQNPTTPPNEQSNTIRQNLQDVASEVQTQDEDLGWILEKQDIELSDLDDEDAAKYISTEEEFKAKEIVWTETNRDYLERQERLEQMKRERPDEYKRLRPGQSKKRKPTVSGAGATRSGRNKNNGDGSNDEGDFAPKPTPSKKLNYSVLASLKHDDLSDGEKEDDDIELS